MGWGRGRILVLKFLECGHLENWDGDGKSILKWILGKQTVNWTELNSWKGCLFFHLPREYHLLSHPLHLKCNFSLTLLWWLCLHSLIQKSLRWLLDSPWRSQWLVSFKQPSNMLLSEVIFKSLIYGIQNLGLSVTSKHISALVSELITHPWNLRGCSSHSAATGTNLQRNRYEPQHSLPPGFRLVTRNFNFWNYFCCTSHVTGKSSFFPISLWWPILGPQNAFLAELVLTNCIDEYRNNVK
jgi:hypothetical protein